MSEVKNVDVITRAKLTLTKYQTLNNLSLASLSNQYNENSAYFTRTLLWKSLLLFDRSTFDHSILDNLSLNLRILKQRRKLFDNYLNKEFIIPWNQLSKDSRFYRNMGFNDGQDITTIYRPNRETVLNDPLSANHPEKLQNDKDTLETIIRDVERLFPQLKNLFINNFENKVKIIEILFVWYKLNNKDYKQGMHEILGLIFKSMIEECISPMRKEEFSKDDLMADIFNLYDANYLQSDCFSIFQLIISKAYTNYYDETLLLQESIKFNLKLHELDKFLYHILITKLKIDSSIWLIRYFRLLLLRELGLEEGVIIWDKLIAFGSLKSSKLKEPFDMTLLLQYIIMILLWKLKKQILESDYGESMYLLLHYPTDVSHSNTNVKMSKKKEPWFQVEKIKIDGESLIQDSIFMFNSSSNLPEVSKILIHKYDSTTSSSNNNTSRKGLSFDSKKKKRLSMNGGNLNGNPITNGSAAAFINNTANENANGNENKNGNGNNNNKGNGNGNGNKGFNGNGNGNGNGYNYNHSHRSGSGDDGNTNAGTNFNALENPTENINLNNVAPKASSGPADFDKTRLEMRLKKRVSAIMNKNK